ncbi:MAG: hypothetical protein HOK61_00140 [Alphaproteobacteria bacterium]|nr:hypothetical protein [Alphaproteobacteria bacterium]
MKSSHVTTTRCYCRRGAALVEFALILPLLLLLLVGSIEIGRGINVRNSLGEAARAGARVFSMRKEKDEADVRAMIDQIMSQAGLKKYTVTLDPDPSSDIKQLDPVTVTVSVAAGDSNWYPTPWFLPDTSRISSSCSMPADLGEGSKDDNSPHVAEETDPLRDDDPEVEGSGVTAQDLKDLEAIVQERLKEARDLREKADKKVAAADAAEAKARESGKKKDIESARKKRRDADDAVKKAEEAEQLARDALRKLTLETSSYKTP